MGKYTEKALKIIQNRKISAQKSARKAYDDAINSDPLLYEIDRKINENSLKMISMFGKDSTQMSNVQKNIEALKDELYSRFVTLKINTDSFEPDYTCKICNDKGFNNGKKCVCLSTLEKEFALSELNDALPIDSSGFENFSTSFYPPECREQMTDIFEFCKAYSAAFNKKSGSILMTGNTGLGKTHLSLSIVKNAVEKGFNAAYGSAQNFLSKIENEHFSRGDERTDTLDMLINADLLIFDDLGTEFSSPYINSTIYSIINTRLLAQKPTVISTNLTLEDMRNRYGDRILSRIMGGYDILRFEGKDIRVLKRMKEFNT